MQFAAATMFPGDLYEAAHRFAADATATQAADPGPAWRQAVAMGWPALLVDEARDVDDEEHAKLCAAN